MNKNIKALYIHIPFCHNKCTYCDFSSIKTSLINNKEDVYQAFTDSIKKEINLYKQIYTNNIFYSLYIGGGTPSVLDTKNISQILSHIYKSFAFISNPEITIECNPQSISKDKLKLYKNLGINRINLGCQSFNDRILKIIGRETNKKEIINKYKLIQEIGFNSVNIDLIYGLPEQRYEDYKQDLNTAISLKPDHLSLYELSKNGKLTDKINKSKIKYPSENTIIKQFLISHKLTKENNYIFYEVSNFAMPEKESSHNKTYWKQENYLGLGPSAVSTVNKKRYFNTKSLKKYITLMENNKTATECIEELNDNTLIEENIMLSLRTKEGLNINSIKNSKNYNLLKEKLEHLERKGLIQIKHPQVKTTKKGLLLLNQIIVSLI